MNRPPDFANRQYYESQSSRVWDAIDVAHLQRALQGSDSLYKMAVWDVSQNVDRFKADLGILPCITPSRSDFASNRQQALSGSQLLLLQGMPLDQMLFANETQRERQDLAGNAMTTTVIGASLISAITCGWSAFQSDPTSSSGIPEQHAMVENNSNRPTVTEKDFKCFDLLKQCALQSPVFEEVYLEAFKQDASSSARYCTCEGNKTISTSPIRICLVCEHTACTACAGNPKHMYDKTATQPLRTLTPAGFIKQWRPRLPARVSLKKFPILHELVDKHEGYGGDPEFLHAIEEAQISLLDFCISGFVRQDHQWKITYGSAKALLELEIGNAVQWLLFVKCPSTVPGNSPLRELLRSPLACGTVDASLLKPRWSIHLPRAVQHQVDLSGSIKRSRFWRSRLGLPDYKQEIVPAEIVVRSNALALESLDGTYEYLPNCGTASNGLYKRKNGASSRPYTFLDPDPIAPSVKDCVVFS